ncbi:MAG TPA: 4-phosphoerythronate dehydrogenase [Bacteroidales bacterium]|nr:4-phosphoerythronate dehydrogenase [Bacteroidales bacterium]
MIKIVADDKIPFLKGALDKVANVIFMPGHLIDNKALLDADAMIIRTRTKCNEDLLKGTRVRFIGTATIGFDHIDTHYCQHNNITWTNAPGCNSASVNQYIVSALLTLSHHHKYPLEGKTIGIVGVGNVGTKVAKSARILGMNVLQNDPPRARKERKSDFVLLGDILYNADIITLHVPLNVVGEDQTWHLFNEKSFKKMRKGSWLINSSRGEVVDNTALKIALAHDKIKSINDVFENEPDIDLDVMKMSFISTPHIAGYSTDGKANGTSMIIRALSRFFGIDLIHWFPDNVPGPSKSEITINGAGKSNNDIIREAVILSYNILNDDEKLRLNPTEFEHHRGNYPVRREFPYYTIKTINCKPDLIQKLKDLGFKIS